MSLVKAETHLNINLIKESKNISELVDIPRCVDRMRS